MKRPRLHRNARLGNYQVLEFAGADEAHSLYTASKNGSGQQYWLLESSGVLDRLADPQHEAFELRGKHYLGFPVEGTSVAQLPRLVGNLEWRFLVPRWAALAEQVGRLHWRGQVLQQENALDLNSILFNDQAQLIPLTYSQPSSTNTLFKAPELGQGTPGPASDVFALGAQLNFLLGGETPALASLKSPAITKKSNIPAELMSVLKKATDPDPILRYRAGTALATALYQVAPGPGSKSPQPVRGSRRALLSVLIALLVLAVIPLFLLFRQGPALLTGLSQMLTPAPTLARAPLPSGDLGLDVLNMNVTADRVAHLELRLTRGGKPTAEDVPIEFTLDLDGRAISGVTVQQQTVTQGAPAGERHYLLSYDTSRLPTTTGTYRITARSIGSTLTRTIYFDKPLAAGGGNQLVSTPAPGQTFVPGAAETSESPGLAGLAISGLQLDSRSYPQLTLYFTASGSGGSVRHLQGPVTVQVEQDGQLVTELAMTPNDALNNPLTVALAIDVSGSMYGSPNANARQAASSFVNSLNAGDKDCIYSFSTILNRVQPCTTDHQASLKAIQTLGASGNTALYDVLATVSDDLAQLSGRKAIVLLSDGADTASHITKDAALGHLKQNNIPVYAIGMVSYQFQRAILKEFVDTTRGSYLEAPASANLSAFYAVIDAQLKNQYRVSFKSAFPDRKSGTLTVRLMQGETRVVAQYPFFVQ